MSHLHNVFDSDTHFLINPTTRAIVNSSQKLTLVQYDHKSERYTFQLPRLVEGHDMSECSKIEVHYLNVSADGKNESAGVYPVDDVQISPDSEDVTIFSWLISGNATKYAGTLNFLVRFTCLTGDVIDYAWHTAVYSGITVSDGMNNGEAVIEEYPDILKRWEESIVAQAINDLGGACNPVTGEETGAIVTFDDVSPKEHLVKVGLRSKNLLDYTKFTNKNVYGITYTANGDGTITANGTNTGTMAWLTVITFTAPESGQYILSGCPAGGGQFIYRLIIEGPSGSVCQDYGTGAVGTLNEGESYTVYISVGANIIVDNLIFKPQLEKGTTATAYTPFIPETQAVTVKSHGKNIFNKTGAEVIYTNAPKTFITELDTGLRVTWAESNYACRVIKVCPLDMVKDKNVTVAVNIAVSGSNIPLLSLGMATSDGSVRKTLTDIRTLGGASKTAFIPNSSDYDYLILYLYSNASDSIKGTASDYADFKNLQIEIGDTETAYEPYIEGQTVITTLAEGATLQSIAPNMTVSTDISGVLIEADYNKDINKVIEKLTNAIIALGGNI